MKKVFSVMLFILLFAITFQSCIKEKDTNALAIGEGKVSFSFSLSQEKSALKSATDSGYVQGITSVVYTIEDLQGNVIKNSEKIEIYNMDGFYISKPISLAVGGYKLTQFFALDAKNNVIYASPFNGSAKAYLVKNTLPISFNTNKDVVTQLVPEVLSAAESTPEDFGYITFNFEISKTFDFLVGAFIYNDTKKNFELTKASISIYSDTALVYSGQLTNSGSASLNYDTVGITNKITLPERFNTFIIKISKPGYKAYCDTFTKEQLRLYYRKEDKGPLVVILEKSGDILQPNTVTDVDGNVYKTVTIGTQIWMAENLRTTKYNNGESIGTTTSPTLNIESEVDPKYQWAYEGNSAYVQTYGRLYTWFAIMDSRKVCPTGWHVPTDAEWMTLINYLGGDTVAGGKLKSTGTTYWYTPNFGATNETGFTALPGGFRECNGAFWNLSYGTSIWSSTENAPQFACYKYMAYYDKKVLLSMPYTENKKDGLSVRCIKN
jgi:uncharacterized protein (TIGR02145 family)